MALLITANGEVSKIEPENGVDFNLKELYKHIDCNLVQVCESDKPGDILIFDEEFLCKNDPQVNELATGRMPQFMGPWTHNVICGNAVLCNSTQFK